MTSFCVGIWEVEAAVNRLRCNGRTVHLEPKVMQVLVRLAERPGEVIRKEDLIRAVWRDTFVTDDVLIRSISELRKVFQDDPRNPVYIETIPRSGYRLIAAVSLTASPGAVPSSRIRWQAAAALPMLVILAATIVWLQRQPPAPKLTNFRQITTDGRRKPWHMAADHDRIYFMTATSRGYAIAQVSTRGGAATLLPNPIVGDVQLLDVSPDGSELLAFSSPDEGGERPLYALSLPDGNARRVGELVATDAAWSPDGQRIVYCRGHGVFIAERDGSGAHKIVELAEVPDTPRWSPDGGVIRVTSAKSHALGSELWDIDVRSGRASPVLPEWNLPFGQGGGNWTPDGEYYLFEAFSNASIGIWALPRRARPGSRPAPVLLTPDVADMMLPVPSRDGKQLFSMVGVARTEVMHFDAGSGRFVPFAPLSGAEFNFTADGKMATYLRLPGAELVQSRTDGQQQKRLLPSSMQARFPALSPDERRIAFLGADTVAAIYIMPASGGKAEKLVEGAFGRIQWSADGRSLVCVDHDDGSLVTVDVKTQKLERIPGSSGFDAPRWSPNGRYLAAVRLHDGAVMLYDVSSRDWRPIAEGRSAFPSWSPDGRYLYFVAGHSPATTAVSEAILYRVDVSSGRKDKVANLNELRRDALGSPFSWVEVQRDGSILALRDDSTVDIYSLDLRHD